MSDAKSGMIQPIYPKVERIGVGVRSIKFLLKQNDIDVFIGDKLECILTKQETLELAQSLLLLAKPTQCFKLGEVVEICEGEFIGVKAKIMGYYDETNNYSVRGVDVYTCDMMYNENELKRVFKK